MTRSHFERYKIPHVASFEGFNLIFLLCCPYGLKQSQLKGGKPEKVWETERESEKQRERESESPTASSRKTV